MPNCNKLGTPQTILLLLWVSARLKAEAGPKGNNIFQIDNDFLSSISHLETASRRGFHIIMEIVFEKCKGGGCHFYLCLRWFSWHFHALFIMMVKVNITKKQTNSCRFPLGLAKAVSCFPAVQVCKNIDSLGTWVRSNKLRVEDTLSCFWLHELI